jgi:hypothetical protein
MRARIDVTIPFGAASPSDLGGSTMSDMTSFWGRPAGSIVRWIGFLPAALIAAVLVHALAVLLYGASSWLNGTPAGAPIVFIAAGWISGAAGAYLGAMIAPDNGRRAAAVVTATVLVILSVIGALEAFGRRDWVRMLDSLAMGAGAVMGAISAHEE